MNRPPAPPPLLLTALGELLAWFALLAIALLVSASALRRPAWRLKGVAPTAWWAIACIAGSVLSHTVSRVPFARLPSTMLLWSTVPRVSRVGPGFASPPVTLVFVLAQVAAVAPSWGTRLVSGASVVAIALGVARALEGRVDRALCAVVAVCVSTLVAPAGLCPELLVAALTASLLRGPSRDPLVAWGEVLAALLASLASPAGPFVAIAWGRPWRRGEPHRAARYVAVAIGLALAVAGAVCWSRYGVAYDGSTARLVALAVAPIVARRLALALANVPGRVRQYVPAVALALVVVSGFAWRGRYGVSDTLGAIERDVAAARATDADAPVGFLPGVGGGDVDDALLTLTLARGSRPLRYGRRREGAVGCVDVTRVGAELQARARSGCAFGATVLP